ncbi:HNH endonuclease signature motif containing protein, partial [Arthrobacter liuii]
YAGTDGQGNHTEIGKVPTPRADVLVMVPVFSLLGATDEPAVLDGFGPIPASMARKLVADGANSFYRVLVDPRDGAPLEIGRKNYRLTETIKRWIRMRDAKCTFPGCTNHTPDNETDHLKAWEHGGTTGTSNLAQLCPKHHRLKHARPWTPDAATKNEPPGWTSPTGRHHKPEHPDREPTQWPSGILPVGVVTTPIEGAESCRSGRPGMRATPDATLLPSATAFPEIAVPPDATGTPEHMRWQQLLAGMQVLHDPPFEEPSGETMLDPDELCATDPLWDGFYAKPFVLPPDPQEDWELLLSLV